MNHETFCDLAAKRFQACQDILNLKSKEYSRDEDKLHNFKIAGQMLQCTPEMSLIGMKIKHDVSILDIVADLNVGRLPYEGTLSEKITDSINYLILLEALITERRQA